MNVRSMTGFGRGQHQDEQRTLSVEIRTVNSRHLEIDFHLPSALAGLEDRLRQLVSSRLERGRVRIGINVQGGAIGGKSVHIDKELAFTYYNTLNRLGNDLQINNSPSIDLIASLPGVLESQPQPVDLDQLWPAVKSATLEALEGVVTMRRTEGQALAADLERHVREVEQRLSAIEARGDQAIREYQKRLEARLDSLLDDQVEPQRLAGELALLAEKSDISEEVTRMRSHLQQWQEVLATGGRKGRRLEFILQELWREVNTTGSKTIDERTSRDVLAIKAAIERLKEQVRNVE